MLVRYNSIHKENVTHLLSNSPYRLVWGTDAIETLLFEQDQEIVGMGSLWINDMHSSRHYIGIYVHSEYRRKGIGKKIYNHLYSKSDLKKLQTAISSQDTVAKSFLESCSFNLARKCYEVSLEQPNFNDSKFSYNTLNELSEVQKNELITLQLANYRKYHLPINALSNTISFDKWKELVLEDIDETHSYVLFESEAIEAYVLTYKYDHDEEREVGYLGGKSLDSLNEYLPFYQNVLSGLITKFGSVAIEADDVDPYAFGALNCFTYDEKDSWDAYIV